MDTEETETEKKNVSVGGYLHSALWSIPIIFIASKWCPEIFPFKSVFDIWISKGSLADWLLMAWPLFAWGVGVNLIDQVHKSATAPRDSLMYDRIMGKEFSGSKIFVLGTLASLFSGVMEEISFRWLLFLSAVAGSVAINFLFFGFLGFGVYEWFYTAIEGPVVNWLSFGYLEPWLFHPAGWQVGAGLLSANALFRDGHKYQGLLGYVNSWVLGLLFFWVCLNYGLFASIVVHFTYDFLICGTVACCTRLRQGSWT